MSIRNQPCAYCGAQAAHADHVVPRQMRRRAKAAGYNVDSPDNLVPACGPCDWRKLSRLLIPPSWEDRLDELNALGIGTFRVWRGDTSEPAFSGVWR